MPGELPPRPDTSGARPRHRWWPVFAVVATILALTGGARAVADTLAGPAGPPTGFPGVVRVDPRPGWDEVGRNDEGTRKELLLRRGTASLYVLALPGYGGDPHQLATDYVDQVLRERYVRTSIGQDAEAVVLASGVPGVRFGYVGVERNGVSVEGVVIAAVGPSGSGVVFDGYAPEGDLAWAIDDLRAMIDGALVA